MDIIIFPCREGGTAAPGHNHPKPSATSAEVPRSPTGCLAEAGLVWEKRSFYPKKMLQVCLKCIPCSVWVKALS